MTPQNLECLRALKSCRAGDHVTFRGRVLRFWEIGGLRMCLIGDKTALTRVELGEAGIEQGASYEFRNLLVQAYAGGWHSVSMTAESGLETLAGDIPVTQDEEYIERTYKILAGVQRKKGRKEGRVPPWRHGTEVGP